MSKSIHPTINKFMEAVYPGNVELAFACFDEMNALSDAADEIISLRSQRDALREALERLTYLGNRLDDFYPDSYSDWEDALANAQAALNSLEKSNE